MTMKYKAFCDNFAVLPKKMKYLSALNPYGNLYGLLCNLSFSTWYYRYFSGNPLVRFYRMLK